MITALVLAAAIAFTPAVSDDTWLDYDNPIKKGQKLFDSPISLYQGRYYVEEHNALRYCIRHRETRHAYHRVSDTGKYRGAYQADLKIFLSINPMIMSLMALLTQMSIKQKSIQIKRNCLMQFIQMNYQKS